LLPSLAPPILLEHVVDALREPRVTKYFLNFALGHLGRGATREDAEEASQDFACQVLPRVVALYNPAEGSFWNYCLTCLRRFLWQRATALRRHIESPRASDPATPEHAAADQFEPEAVALRRETSALVQAAIAQAPEADRRVLQLFYEQMLTHTQIAEALGITTTAAKVRLCRARQRLAPRLAPLATRSVAVIPSSVSDWSALCRQLAPVASFLPMDAQAAIASGLGDSIGEAQRGAILRGIHRLLSERCLFEVVPLGRDLNSGRGSQELRDLFAARDADAASLLRLNSALLEDLLHPHLRFEVSP
jgi:RNA polymerase sigma-70 factor (ECF subfamily)